MAKTYEKTLRIVVKKELHDLFYKNMRDIIDYFERKLSLNWSSNVKNKFVEAAYLRNCILHNVSCADSRLAEISGYVLGEPFDLTSSDVHSFGLLARKEGKELWDQACSKHLHKV